MDFRSRSGASWLALLIFFSLAAVIAVMLMPMICMIDRQSARRANCGNHQRQVLLAMLVYAEEHGGAWPVFASTAAGWQTAPDSAGLDAAATAIASIEFLSSITEGELPTKVLSCPWTPSRSPRSLACPELGTTVSHSPWAEAGPLTLSYGYDWSVPRLALPCRVITADRDPSRHDGRIPVACADGHVSDIKWRNGHFRNRDADNDDIYDQLGDGPMTTPGMGSTTRAWIR